MNKDIRIAVTLPTHPKTIKLMRRLGDGAFYNLIRLWTWVAQNKPEGNLSGMTYEDLNIASGWNGEDKVFIKTLHELKFLELTDDSFIIHDWKEHNEYASKAKQRSDKARKAAQIRHEQDKEMLKPKTSNAKTQNAQCPSPTPTILSSLPTSFSSSPSPIPYEGVVGEYHRILTELPRVKKLGKPLKKQIAARWKEDKDRQELLWWTNLFQDICGMDFLVGKKTDWRATLLWITGPKNMNKILNGNYDRKEKVRKGAGEETADEMEERMKREGTWDE